VDKGFECIQRCLSDLVSTVRSNIRKITNQKAFNSLWRRWCAQ